MKFEKFSAVAAALTVMLAESAMAQHAGDIILSLDSHQRISTNQADIDGIVRSKRVFASEFEPFFTNEPGYDSAKEPFRL